MATSSHRDLLGTLLTIYCLVGAKCYRSHQNLCEQAVAYEIDESATEERMWHGCASPRFWTSARRGEPTRLSPGAGARLQNCCVGPSTPEESRRQFLSGNSHVDRRT